MTKKELEGLKKLVQEAKQLQEDLRDPPQTKDSVRGSLTEFPYIERTFSISGIDEIRYKKVRKKLSEKLEEIQDQIFEMEEWLSAVNDSETRTILRMYYRNGLTQEKIAEELGRSEKTIQRKIKIFWKNVL